MKIKTSELNGVALDWAVAQVAGEKVRMQFGWTVLSEQVGDSIEKWSPSTRWSQGGPLIETYKVDLYCHEEYNGGEGMWEAHCGSEFVWADTPDTIGKSPLVAACRAIVMAKLGEEVEIPGELCDESK